MDDNRGLRNTIILLIVLDIVFFLLGVFIDGLSGLFGPIFVGCMVITGLTLSEYVRRQKDGGETGDNYPEW